MGKKARTAIVGLGFSARSRREIGSICDLAIDAVIAAVDDAGLQLGDVDGLLIGRSPSAPYSDLTLQLGNALGLDHLTLLSSIEGEGTTAIQMVQLAVTAIEAGMVRNVVCVFSDAPIKPASATGSAAFRRTMRITGLDDWEVRYGMLAAVGPHAMAARRYMHVYGATEEHFGAYAVSNRQWAERNPDASFSSPLSLDDYYTSRYVAEPLRTLDCAYPVNGAIALVVVDAGAAKDAPRPAVFVHGLGQGHIRRPGLADVDRMLSSGGTLAAREAYRSASIGPADVDVCQFYDAFSYLGLLSLEDYGFCKRGEAAEFVREANCAPGGRLPVNPGGGHLSGFYLQGMTPMSEAVIQARGDGGARQAEKNEIVLVTGIGGWLDYHAALVLSPLRSLN